MEENLDIFGRVNDYIRILVCEKGIVFKSSNIEDSLDCATGISFEELRNLQCPEIALNCKLEEILNNAKTKNDRDINLLFVRKIKQEKGNCYTATTYKY